jgi:RNA polymerase sigma factor (sigma-70 family)
MEPQPGGEFWAAPARSRIIFSRGDLYPWRETIMTTTRAGLVLRHLRGLASRPAGGVDDRQLLERFAAGRDEAAFEALLRRHGPMVLGVCRRLLRDPNDADDAFQATFLMLARKADAITRGDSVGGWLHQVAYTTALKAKAGAAARQRHEKRAGSRSPVDPLDEVTGRELLAVLDEELTRLPGRHRAPLVLCYLEGKTRDEAAQQLGCPLGTLKRRLEEARACLRVRLERRGLALPAALLATGAMTAAVPQALAAAAAKAVTGKAAVSAQVAGLFHGSLRAMTMGRLKTAGAVLLAAALALAGTGLLASRAPRHPGPATPDDTPAAAAGGPKDEAAPRPAPPGEGKETVVTGRVLDPEGKPVAGAEVAALLYLPRIVARDEVKVAARTKTDGDGRYRMEVTAPPGESYFVHLRAAAKGLGLSAQLIDSREARPDTTIKLVAEETARASLITIEGAAAAGVKLRVRLPNYGAIPEGEPWPGPLTSDERGRVTLRGLGKWTRVSLEIDDDRFLRQRLALEVGAGKPGEEPTFTLAPLRVLEGTVTGEDTGNPMPGARVVVEAYANQGNTSDRVEGRTDERGRYRIIPYDGNALTVRVFPPDEQPFLPRVEEIRWSGAAVKRTVNAKLLRGVLVRGKVTDAGSGKPVAGATAVFWPRRSNNPFYRGEVIGFGESLGVLAQLNEVKSGADGTFRLAALPGQGHLLVKGPTPDYLHVETSYLLMQKGTSGGQRYYPDALIPLDHQPGAEPAAVAVALRRGVTLRGRVLGPDDKPVAEYTMFARSFVPFGVSFHHNVVPVRDGIFELPGCDPEKATPVLVFAAAGRLGAAVELSAKEARDGLRTVRLAPCGSATARFVDEQGKPWANQRVGPSPLLVHLLVVVRPGKTVWAQLANEELQSDTLLMVNVDSERYGDLRTDAEGRVTFPSVIPGATIALMTGEGLGTVKKEFTVKPGETAELPDVVMKRAEE